MIVYSDAVVKAGFGHHSDLRQGHAFDKLPYYGVALERHIMPGTGDRTMKTRKPGSAGSRTRRCISASTSFAASSTA